MNIPTFRYAACKMCILMNTIGKNDVSIKKHLFCACSIVIHTSMNGFKIAKGEKNNTRTGEEGV